MANQQPNQEQVQALARQQAQFMARVWSDPDLKQRLMDDPKAVLREQGAQIPEDVEVRVVESTDQVVYLVLPPAPSDEISDEALESVAGGNGNCLGTLSTFTFTISTAGTMWSR